VAGKEVLVSRGKAQLLTLVIVVRVLRGSSWDGGDKKEAKGESKCRRHTRHGKILCSKSFFNYSEQETSGRNRITKGHWRETGGGSVAKLPKKT